MVVLSNQVLISSSMNAIIISPTTNIAVATNVIETVVLAHGFGTDLSAWDKVLHLLSIHHQVVLFDWEWGFSGSVKDTTTLYDPVKYSSYDAFANDLIVLLQELDVKLSTFVGHSMSAMIGCIASIKRPQLFKKLVLVSASPSTTYREPMGIVGFGRGPLSLPSQLGFLHKGFTHCFLPFKFANNPNMTSPLVLGNLAISSKDHFQFTSMLRSPMYPNYYYIGLEAITIGNVSIVLVSSSLREFDRLGNGGMLIDSGSTYTHLPKPLYDNFISTLQSMITYPRANHVEEQSGFDLCYMVPCPNNTFGDDYVFPSITFRFLNNASIVLPRGNHFYAMGAPNNYLADKCLLFQSMEDSEYGPAGVFGSFQQQNMEIVYDVEKERIGFQQTDCISYANTYQGLYKA